MQVGMDVLQSELCEGSGTGVTDINGKTHTDKSRESKIVISNNGFLKEELSLSHSLDLLVKGS